MKNILGLDLGTNSIGWAIVSIDEKNNSRPNIQLGSRIIPMSQDVLGKFDSGVTDSQTATRTQFRSVRRLRERCLLRRERLLRVLHVLDFLPSHYSNAIGWDRKNTATFGKFINHAEPKLAWMSDVKKKMKFIFMDSFNEMLNDFANIKPGLITNGKKIPLDWTIYYLRKKALTQPITKYELAWILLNFNQKRGYYQLRGDELEDDKTKKEVYEELTIVDVQDDNEKRGESKWYNILLSNGLIYRRQSKYPLYDWKGLVKEFIITYEYEKDGAPRKDKDGNQKYSLRSPGPNDWMLMKKKTEDFIQKSGTTVGSYIYDNLLNNPSVKVRGKLVQTIERKFYKEELIQILNVQKRFHSELCNVDMFEACINELYSKNDAHRKNLKKKDLSYLLVEDLLFYQRPLKSKKSLISNCPYESYQYVNRDTGEIMTQNIKCIAKSNPYFQEFRLWQFVQNLHLYDKENLDKDVTSDYLSDVEAYEKLFYWLNDKREIKQDTLLKDFFGIRKMKSKDGGYPLRWNYVEDKAYPCNTTHSLLLTALKKAGCDENIISDKNVEYRLWQLLYSVEDKEELKSALSKLAALWNLPNKFVVDFSNIPSFKKEYGSYSEKAVKKLLSIMRMGKSWQKESIPNDVMDRIQMFINGQIDETVKTRIGNICSLSSVEDFQGLPLWLACYIVYNRHSESGTIDKWSSPKDMMSFINGFKQHSLRNPIVEQCILECLRTVHDIWVKNGHIDEIHVELGREMKNPADKRKKINERNLTNENTNQRIRSLLLELKNSGVEQVRPYSPSQQEILRIYEEGALLNLTKGDKEYDEIIKISRLAQPSVSDLRRYKLWLEQKYQSPYTGHFIPLSRLFTSDYEIEHIIPQTRYFDDSLSNKVICESSVNKDKSNMLAYEYIKKNGGKKINECFTLFTVSEYEHFVKEHYANNIIKKKKLLMDDIPAEFIQRQMNDSRYISKIVMSLLSNIVRDDDEKEYRSRHVITCTGGITDKLRKDWGINDVWNSIVYSRFERMNKLTNSSLFGQWENKEGKRIFQTTMPLILQNGFSKKRIDHRHHALDALVIACASLNVINYLNNESANDIQRRDDLRKLLCNTKREINKPWSTFTEDAYSAIINVIVSFKNRVRILTKASNCYEHINENGSKEKCLQHCAQQWAVRKPLHKETMFGRVNLRLRKEVSLVNAIDKYKNIVDIKLKNRIQQMFAQGLDKKAIVKLFKKEESVNKVEIYYYSNDENPLVAVRKPLDDSFDKKKIINSVTDTGIQKILLAYLSEKNDDPKLAFAPEGITEMNINIRKYNDGKFHQPIIKVRMYESLGEKFQVGEVGNKISKYAEAQSGTNLFFAIYEDADSKRIYNTIPFNIIVERKKQSLPPVPDMDILGNKLKFYLSPNELVYVPTEEDINNPHFTINDIDRGRIYKFVNSSGYTANFVPHTVSSVLYNLKKEVASSLCNNVIVQNEFGIGSPQSKNERSLDGIMIKNVCWKLEIDRLGNIVRIIK